MYFRDPDIDRLWGLFVVLAWRLNDQEARMARLQSQLASLLTASGAAGGVLEYSCTPAVVPGLAVYLLGGVLDVADSGDPAKMPAVGFAGPKLSEVRCYLRDSGRLDGLALALVPGRQYWIGAAGGLRDTPVPSGSIEQQAGFGIAASALKIALGVPPVVTVD